MSLGSPTTDGESAAAVLAPEPQFAVVGTRPVRHAAAPMLTVDLQVSERSGLQVYMVALSIQVMIEPARRRYDEDTHERLVELFGAPERWAVTTRSLVWTQLDVLVAPFTGTTTVAVPIACHYDLELAAAKYLHALEDGEAPMAMHFNGTIYYRDDTGALQMVLVPWNTSIDFRMPVSVWRETIEHYYPGKAWLAVGNQTFESLQREKVERGLATLDATLQALVAEARRG